MDFSKIDFEALRSRFIEPPYMNTDPEVLKADIRAQLESLILLNQTRADFAGTFEELIEIDNNGSRNIEDVAGRIAQVHRLHERRATTPRPREQTGEELVIFDILARPAPELSADERAEVKKVAKVPLVRLKELLVDNWRQKSTARYQLKPTIEDTLHTGLPRAYDKPLYEHI